MAVFGVAPDFVRVSLRLRDADASAAATPAAALLARSVARYTPLAADDPRLVAWRDPYLAFGLPPELPPPPAVLAAWAETPAGLPSQGPVADLVHAFALQHVVPVSAHDLGAAQGYLWLRPSRGIETYLPLAAGSPGTPELGELILADSADQVLARHWHGAQGRPFALRGASRLIQVHLDLLPPLAGAAEDLAAALGRLLRGFVGGELSTRFLNRARPVATWDP